MTGKPEVPHICEFCLAQNELRHEVQQRGQPIEQCSLCHTPGGRSLPVDDPIVRRIFRALIRLHFSEWNYNEHLGGDSLQSLVFESKAIFNLPPTTDPIDFEDAFLELEEKDWYPENEDDITLGGGY
ncbi:MAG: hypothetical protein LWW83_16715 [Azonexaceae bacterium]|nr:hypothetical protein [Azonexaceae bacterium]